MKNGAKNSKPFYEKWGGRREKFVFYAGNFIRQIKNPDFAHRSPRKLADANRTKRPGSCGRLEKYAKALDARVCKYQKDQISNLDSCGHVYHCGATAQYGPVGDHGVWQVLYAA